MVLFFLLGYRTLNIYSIWNRNRLLLCNKKYIIWTITGIIQFWVNRESDPTNTWRSQTKLEKEAYEYIVKRHTYEYKWWTVYINFTYGFHEHFHVNNIFINNRTFKQSRMRDMKRHPYKILSKMLSIDKYALKFSNHHTYA